MSAKTFQLEKIEGRGIPADARLWSLRIDLPGEKVNKFSEGVMREFESLLGELEERAKKEDIGGLVVFSGKPGIFIAGADIELIQATQSEEAAAELSAQGQALLNRWEDLPFPRVCGVDGQCLGGGCEFALASSAIVMSSSSGARVGLPETLLGLIPGMGGCVRLPLKAGLATALDMILTGKTLSGDRAFKSGVIEACLPKEDFETSVIAWVVKNLKALRAGERLAKEPKLGGMGGPIGGLMENNPIGRSVVFSKARDGVMAKTRGRYPAPLEAIDVMQSNGLTYGDRMNAAKRARAMERESRGFGKVAATSISKNLIRLFFLTEAVKKSKGVEGGKSVQIARGAVLGAGVMGGGIAQLFAEKGISTRMKDLTPAALALGIASAAKIFSKQASRKRITKREFLQKLNLIAPTLDYSGFTSTEVVVEAVVEKMEVKQSVLKELETKVSDDCVIASNTSSLSISKMQSAMRKPERFAGMHFFNPVSKMPLIEVIRGDRSGDQAVSSVYQLSKQLGKTPIVVKDAPGFLVNRLLMCYLNEATYLLNEGATIEEIDEALLDFGMPMGPMELIDEVGVDVGDKVAHILHDAFGERMVPSPINGKVVAANRLGKKNGKGLYVYEGREKKVDGEIYTLLGLSPSAGRFSAEEMVDRCILPMVNEASRCLEEHVVGKPDDVDLGMIMGTGFPPFRGGLLRYADERGLGAIVERLRALSLKHGSRFTPAPALEALAKGRGKFYS